VPNGLRQRNKNGTQKVGLCGLKKETTTQSFFINLQTFEETSTQSGKSKMNKEKWPLPLGKRKSSGNFFSATFFCPPRMPYPRNPRSSRQIPHRLYRQMNLSLEEEVSEPKLKETLFSMSNGKIPGPDGVIVEFFKAFYDFLKEDLLLMIRESQKEGRFHGPLNATFLCLIPKKQFPSSFEDYILIACCNVVYKLITKIISG
jgi:hypothetical protein